LRVKICGNDKKEVPLQQNKYVVYRPWGK